MKVRFRQTGGFAGLSRGCELDDATLPRPEAANLRRLVERSQIQDGQATGPEGARDLTTYEITVETDDGVRTAAFDDLTIPKQLQPLMDYLQRRATPQPLP